jgi:hypothetical protein
MPKYLTNEQKMRKWLASADSIHIAIIVAKLVDLCESLATDEQKQNLITEMTKDGVPFIAPELVINAYTELAEYIK